MHDVLGNIFKMQNENNSSYISIYTALCINLRRQMLQYAIKTVSDFCFLQMSYAFILIHAFCGLKYIQLCKYQH